MNRSTSADRGPTDGLPGAVRTALLVAAKDLRLERNTLDSMTAMVLFALIVLVVFSFAFDLATVRELGAARLVPGVIWATFSFAGIVGFARSFQLERRRESLTALLLSPAGRGALFAGKALANLTMLLSLQLILLPLSAVLFDFDLQSVAPALALVVFVHTAGIAALGTLLGAVSVQVGRGEALLAILLFPAAAPLLISAVTCTTAILEGSDLRSVSHWLLLSTGLDVLFLLVGLLLFEFAVED